MSFSAPVMEGGSSSLNKPATLNETHPIERQQQQLNTMAPKSGNRKKQFLIAPSDLKFSNDQQLQILNSTNEPKSFLAHGGFGLVQKATLNGVEVAVKRFMVESDGSDILDKAEIFVKETKNMRELDHPRIVKLIGFVMESMCIVMELCPLGDLEHFIRCEAAESPPKLTVRWKIMQDIAEGMAYLHSKYTPAGKPKAVFFHQYLKSANVLLVAASSSENNLRAKITDFGFTQLRVSANNSTRLAMTHLGGTLLYQAPELIQSNKYTASCDVYSYGVIFLELITLLHPVEALSDFQDKLQTAVDRNQLPVFFKELPLKCLSYKPSERPPFTEIYNELDRHTLNPVNDKTPPKQQPQPPIFEIQKPSFTEYRYNHKSRPSTSAYILSGVSSMLKTNVSSTWEHDISRSNNIQYSSTLASTSKQENIRHSMLPRNKRKYALVLAFIALLIAIVSVAYVLVLKLRSTPSTSQSSANNINDAVSSSSSTYSSSSASPTFTTISTSTSTSSPAASLIDSRGYCIQCSNTGVEAMFSGDSSSSILAGQSINLTNGIRFTQQSDGNLILYAADGKTQIFSSNTMGMGNNFWSQMQSDGNFVVKVDGNTAVMNTWTGNQPRDGRFCMAILPQGDLAIYSNFNCANPLWQASRGINGNPNCYATWCSYNYNGVLIRY